MSRKHHSRSLARSLDDRRTGQLCGQVFRALSLLIGDCHDDVLRDVFVGGVEPAPNASRLLVTLHATDPDAARVHVERVRGFLRQGVAGVVTRKRVPELVYVVLPTSEASS